ncbi:short-chain dehydrogenase/reductase [Streptomyces agglomeratus]|uniref:Short-chain dehydrogenase/reductase n=1 Tax=Streptomyces agglomeratus TaxID=285458 RepID=A0A1E5PI45_9ACTN|nr:SDR family NAD(P)-dependent oxidoreductase [Streptomyces agglomeratus]OEJ29201.1 short-chain dehydrogenase/reductase [Streptomyces agglomeratus]OEJ48688.1 short-chain dehydrogenase/reductase [Streptomyces agglomeratus]OEJ56108.1 short-chain dehydrogenase/reductase [Streptomyces agglomeratus]OEJ63500.1 short-chain dehydrogenase/reductase [Streptomyces agglomeratus]
MTDDRNTSHTARAWFITGASQGLGRALAVAALDRGDRVAATARRAEAVADLVDRYPGKAIALELDVREESAAHRTVEQACAAFGRIDVVANIAGYGLFGAVEEATDAQARAIFDTNVFGPLNVLRATLPVLRAQRSGHVLQGSSLYGQSAHPGVGLLAASKYALEGLSDALAAELAPLDIKLTLIEPGYMSTGFLSHLVFAEPAADYDATVRAVRSALGELAPEAFIEPARAAAAVFAAVDAKQPPLRLALGRAAEDGLRAALTARLRELDAWADVTRGVDAAPRS